MAGHISPDASEMSRYFPTIKVILSFFIGLILISVLELDPQVSSLNEEVEK